MLIAIEGLYSMDGDFPELPRFVDIKNVTKPGCMSTKPIRLVRWANRSRFGRSL